MADIEKHLERAEKYVNKGKYDAAVEEYKSAYAQASQNTELLRTIADLCVRAGNNDEAIRYYGELFDKYAERNDANKAVPLFRKSLQETRQPPERHARLGYLLQRSGKTEEAVAAYRTAMEQYQAAGDGANVLDCLERLAALEPDSVDTQLQLAEQANQMGKPSPAAKAFLRAGQLVRPDDLEHALQYLERAYELEPERSTALNLGQAYLEQGSHQKTIDLLMPLYAQSTEDPAVLETLATGLLEAQRLAQAEEVLEAFYKVKPDGYEKLFALSSLYCQSGEGEKAVEVLRRIKERLFAEKRKKEFVARLEEVFKANESVIPLAEYSAALFNEVNQEGRYGMVLGKLFDLYLQANDTKRSADTLERLVQIDPYDFSNQKRLERLRGKIDDARFRGISSLIVGAATVGGPGETGAGQRPDEDAPPDPATRGVLLEDLMVQVEIFIQYALKAKAIEKLEKIFKLFPGEESKNPRLYKLYQQAQYFPPGFGGPPTEEGTAAAPAAAPAAVPTETVSDLAKISEITHLLFRQTTPKTVVHTAVSELGKYLKTSRCLGALGRSGKPPSVAVEFCSPGVPQSPGAAIVKLLGLLGQMTLDPESGAVADSDLSPELRQAGAQSVLAMPLVDKEAQEQEGLLVLSQADARRRWKPNEVYLLKAVADQVVTAVSHIKLRSLMKRLSVPDDATGLLARSSYLDCLVSEVSRSRTQGTGLVVALLELDKGAQLMRQLGEPQLRQLMQQAGETLLASIRQTDLAFRYTATTLAVVLGDTTAEKAKPVADKLRSQLSALKSPGGKDSVSFSIGASEAAIRPDYDPADIVTDVINRAEFSLDQARQKGGAVVVD